MTDRAVLHSYHRQEIYWRTLNGKEIIQWNNKELRGDIVTHVIEVISSGSLSESVIFESIEKEFATMDNIELLLAFSHTNRKKYLIEYFSGIIFCIKDLINSDRLGLPQPSISHIDSQVIFTRRTIKEIFGIYRRSRNQI